MTYVQDVDCVVSRLVSLQILLQATYRMCWPCAANQQECGKHTAAKQHIPPAALTLGLIWRSLQITCTADVLEPADATARLSARQR
jgi:hypothetical protein